MKCSRIPFKKVSSDILPSLSMYRYTGIYIYMYVKVKVEISNKMILVQYLTALISDMHFYMYKLTWWPHRTLIFHTMTLKTLSAHFIYFESDGFSEMLQIFQKILHIQIIFTMTLIDLIFQPKTLKSKSVHMDLVMSFRNIWYKQSDELWRQPS